MQSLSSARIRLRFLVLAIAAAVVAAAAFFLPQAALSALPEFTPTYVEIQTEALGLSATEVEQMVTVPLEADLLNGVQDVQVIRSQSVTGLSRIVLVFRRGIDAYVARSRVAERLTQSAALPQVSKPPTMLPPLSTEDRLLMFSMVPDQLTAIETSVLARWTVRPRLMGIPGVASVNVWGMRDRQLQIQVDPRAMQAKNISLNQVIESAGNAQVVSPLTFLEASTPGTGGFIETNQQRLPVRHILDKFATPEELGKVPIVEGGGATLADVARIVEDHQPLIGDAVVSDHGPGLLLVVEKFPGANAAEVTRAVSEALDELKPGLGGVAVSDPLFRAADYLTDVGNALARVGLVTAVLFLVMLLLWYRDWRAPLVVVGTVATSLAAASLVLQALGQSFNPLTFLGLAAAAGLAAFDAIAAASRAAATPNRAGFLGYAVLISLLSVTPALVIGGRPGGFLAPLLWAYGLGVVTAFLATSLVAPALAGFLAPMRSGPFVDGGQRLAGVTGKAPAFGVAAGLAAALGLLSIAGFALGSRTLVPALLDRNLVVSIESAPGTSLPAMTAAVADLTGRLKGLTGIEQVAGHIGRSIGGDRIGDVNQAQVWVTVRPDADLADTTRAVADAAAATTGMRSSVETYSMSRIEAVGALTQGDPVPGRGVNVLTGSPHPVVVRVFGEDSGVLQDKAAEIARALTGIPGLTSVAVQGTATQDSIQIRVDLDRAKASGIKPGDVRRAEATLVQGIQVGSIFQKQQVFDVIVRGAPETRSSIDAVRDLVIDSPNGKKVKLSDVAEVTRAPVPVSIDRDAVARRVDVVADLAPGANAGQARDAVQAAIATVSFPLEHHAELLADGGAEVALPGVIGVSLGAAAAILLLLQAAFGSWRLGSWSMLVALAGTVGSALAGVLFGVNAGSLLGGLVVFGIGCRLGLLAYGGDVVEGAGDPAGPSVPTLHHRSLAGGLGGVAGVAVLLLPVAVLGGAGFELAQPFAWSVLLGLVSTVAVTLLVLPAIGRTMPSAEPVPVPAGQAPPVGGIEEDAGTRPVDGGE